MRNALDHAVLVGLREDASHRLAADLLGDLPDNRAQELLDLMDPEDAKQVRQLLSYADDSAGGLMTTEPVIVGPETSIATCLALVQIGRAHV